MPCDSEGLGFIHRLTVSTDEVMMCSAPPFIVDLPGAQPYIQTEFT